MPANRLRMHSVETRNAILKDYEDGMVVRLIIEKYNVSRRFIYSLLKKQEAENEPEQNN